MSKQRLQVISILTTLTDKKYTAKELAEFYHERWEVEISFDELKNELFALPKGKQPTHFRSKKPSGILQEAWGMLLCYNLVRGLMVEAAAQGKVSPENLVFQRF